MIHLINLALSGILIFLGVQVSAIFGFWTPEFGSIVTAHQDHQTAVQPTAPLNLAFSALPNLDVRPVATSNAEHASQKSAYEIIVEKDLFHPSRKKESIPPIVKPANVQSNPQITAPKPKDPLPRTNPTAPRTLQSQRTERLALQGIIIYGDYQRALIADLVRKPRDPVDVGVGDTIGRYTVKEILADKVVLVAETNEKHILEILAEDKLHRRSHIVTPTPVTPTTAVTATPTAKPAKPPKRQAPAQSKPAQATSANESSNHDG